MVVAERERWLSGTGKRRYRVSGITNNTWSVQCDSVRTAALSHIPRFLLTTSVLKQRELPATVSSFYVSVLYTAMPRTSIAVVVLGCFYFCPSGCDALVTVVDCAAVEAGCMLEKYIKVATKYVFIFIFWSRRHCCCCCCVLLPTTSVLKRREVLLFLFWWLRCCCSSLIERDALTKNTR